MTTYFVDGIRRRALAPSEDDMPRDKLVSHIEHNGVETPRSYVPPTHLFYYSQRRQHGQFSARPELLTSSYVANQLPGLLKEKQFHLGHINKVFASCWLSDRQVVFGTKCNKLIVMDVFTKQMAQIPSLLSSKKSIQSECPCGIHAIAVNPSRSLLATGGDNVHDVAIYRLPTLDPVCIGERGHSDWMFDVKWLDDQHLITGSRDRNLCLWRVPDSDDSCDTASRKAEAGTSSSSQAQHALPIPAYGRIRPLLRKRPKHGQPVRALAYNERTQDLAALSLSAHVHFWDVERMTQKLIIKLKYEVESVCMTLHDEQNAYAVGSRSYVTMVDPRDRKNKLYIQSPQQRAGIRSIVFNGHVMSIGSGIGNIFFFDLRTRKYLDLQCGHALSLKAGDGWLRRDDSLFDIGLNDTQPNAIYTHCYDESRTKLFAAGGPLQAVCYGNYAGLWH